MTLTDVLDSVSQGFPGPSHALLGRLHEINWSWLQTRGCKTTIFTHVLHTPIQQLTIRLEQGWHAYVGGLRNQHRSMQALERVDVSFSTQGVVSLSPDVQGMLRVIMNGTFYTNNKLAHCNAAGSEQCPWCDKVDSANHRHFACPFMDDIRSQIHPDILEDLRNLPENAPNSIVGPLNILKATSFDTSCSRCQTLSKFTMHIRYLDMTCNCHDGGCLRPETARLRHEHLLHNHNKHPHGFIGYCGGKLQLEAYRIPKLLLASH